ncbi:MAG: VWA domain-containing protein [Gammaproteobacteria bacterium]|nr:VWA domain-containing protein [Gammaproteobacteria bacterium]
MSNLKRVSTGIISFFVSTMLLSCAQSQNENQDTSSNSSAPAIAKAEQDTQVKYRKEAAKRTVSQSSGVARQTAEMSMAPPLMYAPQEQMQENYAQVKDNGVIRTERQPLSTFSIDVDTGAYSNMRRFLESGRLPPSDSIRLEEMINYFVYEYDSSNTSPEKPFQWTKQMVKSPWKKGSYLLQLGLQTYKPAVKREISNNLVFLIDVSGSMRNEDKLPLLKKSIKLMLNNMSSDDRVAFVVYAGASGVVLPPTKVSEQVKIVSALEQLQAGGSTNGGEGLKLAYQLAAQHFKKDGNNRVILATDGDFNVGIVNQSELIDFIKAKQTSGIYLTTLGFGQGNYNDHLMEQLANKGNGQYAYIDSLLEAKRVLIDRQASALDVMAKDVKIQVEFNPAVVAEYRLIGYQNRKLRDEDFENDKVDAGEVGVGHSVTALYEITLTDSELRRLPELRYGQKNSASGNKKELGFLKLRYKKPDSDKSTELAEAIELESVLSDEMSPSFRLASAVTAFGMWLRDSDYLEDMSIMDIEQQAKSAVGVDPFGADQQLVQLIGLARALKPSKLEDSASERHSSGVVIER